MTDSTTPGASGDDSARTPDENDENPNVESSDAESSDAGQRPDASDVPDDSAVDTPSASSDTVPDETATSDEPVDGPASSDTASRTEASDFTDVPTGEVITGPIDAKRLQQEARTTAYSQTPQAGRHAQESRPPTKEMPPLGTGEFPRTGSDPSIPAVGSSPEIPVTHSAPVTGRRGRGRTIALISAAVVLLLVIAGVGTELYMRNKVTSCIEDAFGNLTGAPTSVSVSRKPMLLSAFGSDVPWVQVDTSDGEAGKMRLHARAEGISTDGGTVRSLDGSGYLPYDRISALSDGESNGGPTIKEISADQSAGTIKLSTEVPIAIINVPATVTLKPTLTDGGLTFEVKEATALMFGLPAGFAQPIVDQVTNSMFGPLFKQIKVKQFAVEKDGIEFQFAGQDVNLKAASESGGDSSGSGGSCSI